jgi:hypothetical protein
MLIEQRTEGRPELIITAFPIWNFLGKTRVAFPSVMIFFILRYKYILQERRKAKLDLRQTIRPAVLAIYSITRLMNYPPPPTPPPSRRQVGRK